MIQVANPVVLNEKPTIINEENRNAGTQYKSHVFHPIEGFEVNKDITFIISI